ncbi:MAG TPA: F0F1 ATP synthase subunit delta [Gemmatimonadaceae bacterium]|nr:F0F1 ATP synthase subunit delta [Gemmatimonadaceae bacterium]
MRPSTIARNYAEALLELARRAKDLRGWGSLVQGLADAVRQDESLRRFLETPRVDVRTKTEVLRKALTDRAPSKFVRFVESVVRHRRQMLFPQIAQEYMDLVDLAENRMHANVTVAREADEKTRKMIADRLSKVFDKTVVPHLTVDARILGGLVVRVGDTVMDGSVRRKLGALKQKMLAQRD